MKKGVSASSPAHARHVEDTQRGVVGEGPSPTRTPRTIGRTRRGARSCVSHVIRRAASRYAPPPHIARVHHAIERHKLTTHLLALLAERAALGETRLAAGRLAEHRRAAAADDDRLRVAEDRRAARTKNGERVSGEVEKAVQAARAGGQQHELPPRIQLHTAPLRPQRQRLGYAERWRAAAQL